MKRDYSLTGPEGDIAVENGLAGADWYHSPVDRQEFLALMTRTNTTAAWHTALWFVLLGVSAWWLITTWFSWWTLPAAFVYGTLYGSVCDPRWHECGHKTAFASKRANEIVYHIASFMDLREPISWRWSHLRHHADTIIVGRDPEIAFQRPPSFFKIFLEMFAIVSAREEFKKYFSHLVGRLTAAEATYIPEREQQKAIFWGRVHLGIWLGVMVVSISQRTFLPIMLVGGPSLYGRWLLMVYGATQHAGLAEDVLDHRLNTRTVYMNPVSRFLYLNMNYHLEHHMYPAIPYRNLPQLHALIGNDLPAPHPNIVAAYADIFRTWKAQKKDPSVFLAPKAK